jgi:hypothetical protein
MGINNFGPFYSVVWGTVFDFLTLILSIATTYFLIRTLRSQQNVEKDQQLVSRISFYDFISKLKPELKLIGSRSDDRNHYKFHLVKLNDDYSNAFNLYIRVYQIIDDQAIDLVGREFLFSILGKDGNLIEFHSIIAEDIPKIRIQLWYEDGAGKYMAEWQNEHHLTGRPYSDGLIDRSLFNWRT